MTVEECSPLYPPPCALVANHQMDLTSLTSACLISMNNRHCLRLHARLRRLRDHVTNYPVWRTAVVVASSPRSLRPLWSKNHVPDVVVQQADRQWRAGRCEQDRSAADE